MCVGTVCFPIYALFARLQLAVLTFMSKYTPLVKREQTLSSLKRA